MTVTVTYTSLTTLINALSGSPSTAEAIIDHAINKITLYGYTIANLTGSSGSKTGAYTQAEAAAILDVATTVYAINYKSSGSTSSAFNMGGIGQTDSGSVGNAQTINDVARQAAQILKAQNSDPPIYFSNPDIETY